MNLRTWLIINAVISAIFGLAFLIVPDRALSYSGLATDATGLLTARYLGAEMVGAAAITWLMRKVGDPEARRGLVLALFIGWGVGLVVSFLGLSASSLGWVSVVVYGFFTVVYGYFQFTTPGAGPVPASRPTPTAMSSPPASSPAPSSMAAKPLPTRKPARRAAPTRRR